jgi:hypothetical protein
MMGWVNPGRQRRVAKTAMCGRAACVLLIPAVTAWASAPAAAQQANALTRTQIHPTATLQNDADMDFGDIIPSAGGGTVVMTPSAAATCSTTGGLVRSGPCKAAEFTGTAFTGASLRVRRPNGNSITLTGPAGATMTVTTFTFGSTAPTVYQGNPGNSPNHRFRVDAGDGSYTFYVGGTLNVGGNQFPGIYNGAFEIDVSYN